jgi:hypothetical protein
VVASEDAAKSAVLTNAMRKLARLTPLSLFTQSPAGVCSGLIEAEQGIRLAMPSSSRVL